MTVAAIALIIGLAGTAIAGPDAITSALTQSKVKKIAKKQAKKQIKKAAPGLSVKHAATANTADTAKSAETARPTGPAGGDLAGTYPDPSIGDQGVSSDEIADDAVTSAKIANEQVRASELGATQLASADSNTVANGATAWRYGHLPSREQTHQWRL